MKRLLILILFVILQGPVYATDSVFEDNFLSIDDKKWLVNQNDGLVEIQDGGILKLSSATNYTYPYIHTIDNTFPQSTYSASIRFKLDGQLNYGAGIVLSDKLIENSTPNNLSANDIVFLVWPETSTKHTLWTRLCEQGDASCSVSTLKKITSFPANAFQELKIDFDGVLYSLTLNDILTKRYIADIKLNYLWIGNPQRTSTTTIRPSVYIDFFKIVQPEIAKTPVVILPGFGGSWDVGAVLTNTPGNSWKIPDFVKEYDGIINSLKNAGYIENEDLFVFAYDWRKPLNTLADDLNSFMISKNIHNKKTNLVGHSMGGLVARTYLQKYNNPNIDKVITAGSPHKGILDAYAMWEGLTVWDAVWWQKAMHLIATEVNRESGELKIESARRNAPSVKDLLPTDTFLKMGKSTLQVSNMIWKNDTLASLNSQVGNFSQKIVSGFSSSNQTKSNLSVSKAPKEDLLRGLWEDGKPVTKNPFLYNVGDGYVTSSSSGSLFGNTIALDGWHGETISKKENVVKILSELGVATESAVGSSFDNRKKFLVFKLNSPGTLSVCLAAVCNEQIGQYFAAQKMLIVPGFTEGDYKAEILAQGETGKYELVTGKIDEVQDWDSQQGELKTITQTDSYLYNTKTTELVPNKLTANNNLLSLFPSGVDPRKINKIRQEILKKIDTAMKTNETVGFDNEIAKWLALDGYVQTMELSKINWFNNRDWDEHHFGLYKSKYLPKTKNYFNEVLFTLVNDLEESSKFVNKKDWLKILDKKAQLLQLKHFLGHGYGSGF